MTAPATVAFNFASMLFLLRDRPEAREQQIRAFKTLLLSLGDRGVDFRANEHGLRAYGMPVPDGFPLAGGLRTHLLDRGIGELRLTPGFAPATLLAVLRALVQPPGLYRSLHEMLNTLEIEVRQALTIAPPAPESAEEIGAWSLYAPIGPELERQAATLQAPATRDPARLGAVLERLTTRPGGAADDPDLTEAVTLLDGVAARGEWDDLLDGVGRLVRLEAAEGGGGRAYAIALRRLLPRSVLEQIARMVIRPERRDAATAVLRRMGAESTEALLGLLVSADRIEHRRAYFDALRQMTEGTDLLVNMLTHDEWFVVRNVADLCGEMGLVAALPRLARHVAHPDERVRRSVVAALARIGTAGAVEPLRRALRDPSPGIRLQVLQALDAAQGRPLAMPIVAMLDEETHPDVVREMLLALGRIGTPEAVQALQRATVPERKLFGRRETARRLAAVEALGAVETPAARAALEALLADADAEVRRAAQVALARDLA